VDVKVYSTPTCPYCTMTKNYLKEKGIKFDEIDVSMNQEAADRMVNKSGQMGVPVVEINGEMIIGFDKEKIEKKLNA